MIVERAEPIVQVATLQDVVDRPVRAGVQINFPGFLCSRGIQRHLGRRQKSFITASHCTTTQGGVERTPLLAAAPVGCPDPDRHRGGRSVYVRKGPGCPNRCATYTDAHVPRTSRRQSGLGLIARLGATKGLRSRLHTSAADDSPSGMSSVGTQ